MLRRYELVAEALQTFPETLGEALEKTGSQLIVDPVSI
jgi:hypothetical protein